MTLQSSNWIDILQLILAIFTFSTVIIALILARQQITEAIRQRCLQATMEITNLIADENYLDKNHNLIRHHICQRATPISYDEFCSYENDYQTKLLLLLMAHDRAATLIKLGMGDKNALYDWQRFEIEMIWENMQNIVFFTREDPLTEKGQTGFCHNLEWLATEWLLDMKKKPSNKQ